MFSAEFHPTPTRTLLSQLELIYHISVRNVRKTHGNAVIGLLLNMMQTAMMIIVFYVMYKVLGLASMRVRGDFVLYIMSGVFLYFTHTRAIMAVSAAEGATSAMMKHAPMNPIVSICAAALSSLYLQVMSMAVVLGIYVVAFKPVTIEHPIPAVGMILLAWLSGVGIGLIFRAAKPWQPEIVGIAITLFTRANMVASGKMFLVNSLPTKMRHYFSWNPLFHTIDQARGFVFVNYQPHFTSVMYPVYVTCVCVMIGLIAEYYTGRHASLSWDAGR
ncbi:MAG: ABC transporter permease [Rhodobacteraceae bacterium]|nr:ABC transporter permease [Paracoccaceae bacterium]